MWYPPITAGVKRIRKVLAYAFDIAIVQFFVQFSVPVASPNASTAIPWANDDDGLYFHPCQCCCVDRVLLCSNESFQMMKMIAVAKNLDLRSFKKNLPTT